MIAQQVSPWLITQLANESAAIALSFPVIQGLLLSPLVAKSIIQIIQIASNSQATNPLKLSLVYRPLYTVKPKTHDTA